MAQSKSDSDDVDEECMSCLVNLLQQTGQPPIYDCGAGHLLCHGCYDTLSFSAPSPICPTCKVSLSGQRNRALERVRDKRLKRRERERELLATDGWNILDGQDVHVSSDFVLQDANIVQEEELAGEAEKADLPEEAGEADVSRQLPKGGKKADQKKRRAVPKKAGSAAAAASSSSSLAAVPVLGRLLGSLWPRGRPAVSEPAADRKGPREEAPPAESELKSKAAANAGKAGNAAEELAVEREDAKVAEEQETGVGEQVKKGSKKAGKKKDKKRDKRDKSEEKGELPAIGGEEELAARQEDAGEGERAGREEADAGREEEEEEEEEEDMLKGGSKAGRKREKREEKKARRKNFAKAAEEEAARAAEAAERERERVRQERARPVSKKQQARELREKRRLEQAQAQAAEEEAARVKAAALAAIAAREKAKAGGPFGLWNVVSSVGRRLMASEAVVGAKELLLWCTDTIYYCLIFIPATVLAVLTCVVRLVRYMLTPPPTAAQLRALRDPPRRVTLGMVFTAAAKGQADEIEYLIAARVNVDAKSPTGTTALMVAAQFGQEKVCKVLINAKCTVDVANSDGGTALCMACLSGFDPCVRVLVAARADVNRPGPPSVRGETALLLACHGGHEGVVQTLIAAKADLEMPDLAGCVPLVSAVKYKQPGVVRRLIAGGCNVNHTYCGGVTALMLASHHNQPDIVTQLIRAKCNVDQADLRGGENALHEAAALGHVEVTKRLIEGKCNLDFASHTGCTALWLATDRGNKEVVQLLLDAGCSRTVPEPLSARPLRLATDQGGNLYLVDDGKGHPLAAQFGQYSPSESLASLAVLEQLFGDQAEQTRQAVMRMFDAQVEV